MQDRATKTEKYDQGRVANICDALASIMYKNMRMLKTVRDHSVQVPIRVDRTQQNSAAVNDVFLLHRFGVTLGNVLDHLWLMATCFGFTRLELGKRYL